MKDSEANKSDMVKTRQMIDAFIGFYVRRKISKEPADFNSFLKSHQNYGQFCSLMIECASRLGTSLDEFIYKCMDESQRRSVGVLFKLSDLGAKSSQKDPHLEDLIKSSGPFKDYQMLAPYLTKGEAVGLVDNVSKDIYHSLPEGERTKYSQFTVKRHVLNLGFVHMIRSGSYKPACQVIIHYPALFRNVPEVIDRIVDRYVEETLATISVKDTEKGLNDLRAELKRIYGQVNKG